MNAIETHALTKRYGSREVLQKVNLCVPSGSLFGFLGPNGAGKTTTIRILLGLLRSTSGHATVLGLDAWKDGPKLRAHVGYLPGDIRLYDQLSGAATLAFFARARRVPKDAIRRLADRFDLDLRKRVRSYSRGMKQKLGIIQALMHRPEVLVLDEPTTALDPLVRETLLQELRAAVREGRTVLFSSHTLSEVEELCDWIAIVRAGQLIEQEKIEVLRARAVRHVEVTLRPGAQVGHPLPEGLQISTQSDGKLVATWTGPVDPLLAWLARHPVVDLTIAPPGLEDLFMTYYGVRRGEVTL